MLKKKIASVFLIGVLLLTAGCAATPKLENGQEKFASIDGYEISADDLYAELKDRGGLSIMLEMVDDFIVNKEIKDQTGADSYAEGQIEMYKEYYGDSFEDTLVQYGYNNVDDFKAIIKNDYLKQKVALNYLETTVTDSELNEYYENKIYGDQTVKYILIRPAELDSDATDEDKLNAEAEALKEAKEIIKKINNGEKFEDLAKEYSDDSVSALNGGLLSGFNLDQVDEEFFVAANALKDGEMTKDPVQDSNGYNVILKVSSEKKPKLDEVKNDILETLAEEKLNADENAYNDAWYQIRKKYNLEIVDTDVKTLYQANYE
ncbi:MAG: peptidylprolyl isomerase [Bacilli bacterium]|nr:peptidylprolyl isomerase [Bacilli bacterium]